MSCRVKLTPYTREIVTFGGRNTLRIRIVASDAIDMPAEIFLYERTRRDPHTAQEDDLFLAVCSPYDLSHCPANTPSATQSPAFFRQAAIDVLVPRVELADDVIMDVVEQVNHLIGQLVRLDGIHSRGLIVGANEPTKDAFHRAS